MRFFKISKLNDIVNDYLFPIDRDTGESLSTYEALQVMRLVSDCPVTLDVDGVRHVLHPDSFIYGLSIHPSSKVDVFYHGSFTSKDSFTLFCEEIDSHIEPCGGPRLVVDQPADESDAYDAFIQAQKTLHQQIYVGDYEDEDSDLEPNGILSDYDDDEIPTPYELVDDPMADEIEDRIRRVPEPDGPPEPPAKGSDVPSTGSTDGNPPQEA